MARVVGDIGGTNARFAWVESGGALSDACTLPVTGFSSFETALDHFLAGRPVDRMCIAIACPVHQDRLDMTNNHWALSKQAVINRYNLSQFDVLNDFIGLAHAIPYLDDTEIDRIGDGSALPNRPIAILGPGTGLGASSLIPDGDRWFAVEGEGGHVDFAPVDETEIEILRWLKSRHSRVSVERLLSGMGLENIYQALCDIDGVIPTDLRADEITHRALVENDTRSHRCLMQFCAILGSTAGNLALTLGAMGGLYLGGGIARKLGQFIAASPFRQRFENKGRLRPVMQQIPTFLIKAEYAALTGAAMHLLRQTGRQPVQPLPPDRVLQNRM